MSEQTVSGRAVTAAGFVAFLLTGVVQSTYGPSLPHIASRFHISGSTAGLIVTAYFLGECIGIATMGLTRSRVGVGRRLMLCALVFCVGLMAAALAPSWPLLLLAAGIAGCGAGGLVILVNLYFATRFGHRSAAMLSLVNAIYGVGSFLGPALVGITGGYAPVLAGAGIVGLLSVAGFTRTPRSTPQVTVEPRLVTGRTVGFVAAFAVLLFIYEGLEAGVGTWEATDLVSLGGSVQFAAAATSFYWVAFTLGRVFAAPLAVRLSPPTLILGALAVAAVVLLGIRANFYAPLGFAIVGLCAAPIFPVALTWLTKVLPNAATVLTYVILGAIFGSAMVPAILGRLISVAGIRSLPLGVAACAIATFCIVAVVSVRLRERLEASA
ncbi:MAG TPA: MFS transporter [Candidatus Dormibacteraeota bacterium]